MNCCLSAQRGPVSLHDEEKWNEAENDHRQYGNYFDVGKRRGLPVNHEGHDTVGLPCGVDAVSSFSFESLGQPGHHAFIGGDPGVVCATIE